MLIFHQSRGRREGEVWQMEGVRFVDGPNTGLVDFVKSSNIIVPWQDSSAFLEDERRLEALLVASEEGWNGSDDPVSDAVDTVLRATGEELFFQSYGDNGLGHLEISTEAATRILTRTNLDWDPLVIDPVGYVDRRGKLHLPFRAALKIAKAFAAAEPESVNLSVMGEQFRWEEECRTERRETTAELVNKWRAGWTLAKQWTKAGAKDQDVELSLDELRRRVESTFAAIWRRVGEIERRRTSEIQKLRSLVERAAADLATAGASECAEQLLAEMMNAGKPARQS